MALLTFRRKNCAAPRPISFNRLTLDRLGFSIRLISHRTKGSFSGHEIFICEACFGGLFFDVKGFDAGKKNAIS